MRIVLAGLAGALGAGLATVLWMFFARQPPPTIVPAAIAAVAAVTVANLGKKKPDASKSPS